MIQDKIEQCLPHKDPLERADYTEAEVQALRACQDGTATERQQRVFFEYIIRAAGTYDLSLRPDNQYLTAFAEGKRFVGNTLIWMLKAAPTRTDPDKIAARSAGDENDRADNR